MTRRLGIAVALALTLAAGSAHGETWELWDVPWHDGAIAAVDATGDTAVSLSWDGTLRWWTAPGLEPLGMSAWDPCEQALLALSPDGNTAALLEGPKRRLVLLARDGAVQRLEPGGSVRALAWVDGALIAGLADGALRRWEPGRLEALTTLPEEEGIVALAPGPGGLLVGRGSEFGSVELREPKTLALVRAMTLDTAAGKADPSSYFLPPNGLAWSADGAHVAAAAEDALVWDVGTGLLQDRTARRKDGHSDGMGLAAVAFEGTAGESLLVANMPLLVRWDTATGRRRESIVLPDDWNGALHATIAIRPKDGWVLTGDLHGGLDVRGLDGALRSGARGQHALVQSVAFSPRADVVVAGHGDGSLTVWVAATGRRVGAPVTAHDGGVSAVAFAADGTRLATAGGSRVVLWKLSGPGGPVSLGGHLGGATDVAWAPDGGRVVTTAADGRVRLWDGATGEQVRSWEGHEGGATSVAWGPDGRIASVGEDGVVRVWSPDSDAPLHASSRQPRAYTAIAWSPDGETLATAEAFRGDASVRLWVASDVKETRDLDAGELGCHDLVFASEGKLIAACLDAKVRMWSLPSGVPAATLHAVDGYGMSVAVSATGGRIALGTAGQEQALRVWTRRP